LHVRLRYLIGAVALVLPLSTIPPVEASARSEASAATEASEGSAASSLAAPNLEAAVAETLEANPGSVQLDESTVLLKPGVLTALPDGEVGLQAANDCPRGWSCAWTHSNFQGGMLGLREGDYESYVYWWWNPSNWAVTYCDWRCDLEGWRYFSNSVSSVFNNTYNVVWAPFWSPRNNANYYAYNGAPAAYVTDRWNDSFTAACACA
jgi:hypothetical protein